MIATTHRHALLALLAAAGLGLSAAQTFAEDAPPAPGDHARPHRPEGGERGGRRGERREERGERREEMDKKMLERFDTNKDGKLDEHEREAMHQTLASEFGALKVKLDTDKDGKVSHEELKSASDEDRQKFMRMHRAHEMRERLLKEFDVNKDGKLDEGERKSMREAMEKRHERGEGERQGEGKGEGKGECGPNGERGEHGAKGPKGERGHRGEHAGQPPAPPADK